MKREREKRCKYQELAANLARRYPGYRIKAVPVVLGELGAVDGLRRHLGESQLFTDVETTGLVKVMQREVVCCSTRILQRHHAR